jgi:glycosyltransferase involved in cell wall biosynthesis
MRILVISSACIVDVNRAPYIELSSYANIDLTLLIPYRQNEVKSHQGISDYSNYNFPVFTSKIIGNHPRLESIYNLREIIDIVKPDNIILEFDVATYMTYQAIRFSRKYNSKISFIALENFNRKYLKESFFFLIKFNFKKSIGALFTSFLLMLNRRYIYNIFCVSNDGINAMLHQNFPSKKLIRMPLGINTNIFFPFNNNEINKKRNQLGLTSTVIGYFGRVIPEKGLDRLIIALNELKDLEWQLLLDNFSQHKSDYLDSLSKLISDNNLQDRIVYFEAKHEEMPIYINCADIVVLPSIQDDKFKEQYGRVVAEAICCGKIVLVSNTGALPELANEVGYIFNDSKQLVSILKNLILNHKTILEYKIDDIVNKGQTLLSSEYQAQVIFNNL